MHRTFVRFLRDHSTWITVVVVASCGEAQVPEIENYSCARLDEVVVTHIALDLTVDFDRERIAGTAILDIDNKTGGAKLYLDTWALVIHDVRLGESGTETTWVLGDSLPLIGRPLVIDITPQTRRVSVKYATGDDARGLQWLAPEQTMGRRQPFLYTQSQAILARSWVPCQDTPEVRITYSARVRTPPGVIALMSARNPREKRDDGVYEFEMPQPIPSYLLALAVGDVEYRPISSRCGVYAEPELVDEALWEFTDMEHMIKTAEEMYGPYRWEQFDVLVLPPSFPYGGMENPRLTFATPILVAGDRSLVTTIAHELAHSWAGNLVTNATWDDFWLNEGFTTYFERRVMEELYGPDLSEMDALLGRKWLDEEIETEGPESHDTALHIPLAGRDPDEELGVAPYEKGYLFLRLLEETFGRERFDAFLRRYFEAHAFRTMTTQKFVSYLERELLAGDGARAADLLLEDWLYEPGIPPNAPQAQSSRFEHAERQAADFIAGTSARDLETSGWSSQEWQHFLGHLDAPLTIAQMDDLVQTFQLTKANGEVQRSWFLVVIENEYGPGYGALERYLVGIGRRWLIRPIYSKLAETQEGLRYARRIYRKARPGYHSVTRRTVDQILEWEEPPHSGN